MSLEWHLMQLEDHNHNLDNEIEQQANNLVFTSLISSKEPVECFLGSNKQDWVVAEPY